MTSKIKTRLALLLIVIQLLLSNFRIVSAAVEEKGQEGNYQEILSVAAGKSSPKIDYFLRDNKNDENILIKTGVETFTVDNEERIYLSNFASGKIKIYYRNRYENEIDISNFYQPEDIENTDNSLYIFEDIGKITELSSNGEIINEYKIPTMLDNKGKIENDVNKSMAIRLINDYLYDQITVLYDNNLLYMFKSGIKNQVFMDNFKLEFLKGRVYKRILGIDGGGYFYISGIKVINQKDRIEIEELIYKFNNSGKLLAVAETVNEKNYIVPYKYLDINRSGDVFQLLVLKDRVKVYKLKFIEAGKYRPAKDDIPAEEQNTKDLRSAADKNLPARQALYKRAEGFMNYKWIYNPETNAINSNRIEIPYYLQKIKKAQEVIGIPYCWGGFDSLDTKSTNQSWDNFVDAVSEGAVVGNVGITSNYYPGTAGLDCSGFISAVLGLDSKKPSWSFLYSDKLVKKINYNRLELMDILVKNGHMFFYLNKNNYGIRSIETNTLGSEWRVKYFNWSWRSLRDTGYSARRYKKLDSVTYK